MQNGDIIYFKCKKRNIERFFCLKIFTDKTEIIESIIEQLGRAYDDLGLVYIEEKEFYNNVILPQTKNIRDGDSNSPIVGEMITDFF
jgi:hypothetical protein